MHGILCETHGSPEVMVYQELPDPNPSTGELVVKAQAIGVNFVDTMRRSGRHPSAPPAPLTPGIELVGQVHAIGDSVSRFQVGDRVIGRCVTHGACAELVNVEERFAVACPTDIPSDQAAGLFVNPQTAFHALVTMANVQPGESVLITAAAGGVGLSAVQMAKALGAHVIATAGTAEKLDLAQDFGADVAIDYKHDDWPKQVSGATGGRGVDVILESVGGAVTSRCLKCWAPGGRMVVFGNASGEPGMIPGNELLFGNRSVYGLAVGTVIEDEALMRSAMDRIFEWFDSGALRIHVGLKLPLQQAAEAHRRLESRQTVGKIVLMP